MKLTTLYLSPVYINRLDELVQEGYYPNRADAIRAAIRDMLKAHNKFYVKTGENLK